MVEMASVEVFLMFKIVSNRFFFSFVFNFGNEK